MKQLIKYWQDVQRYNEQGEPTDIERIDLEIELDTESPSCADQIATIKGYCGDDYTITELPAEPPGPLSELQGQVTDLGGAFDTLLEALI